ncbi:hypothetical protein [Agromyces sp. Marseille-P2726]|uniref:hypothetical protein n=1 Tax=Agromyces sp. Marseille-P2726 TaxID=2709132 RepID=UPI00156D9FED|nr:hypothetical protein [Agromyces sp. Marseille-P2726]
MNTTSITTRLTAAAAAAALAVTIGAANAASAAEADSNVAQIVRPVTTPAMHRVLVREGADRYLRELLVRAHMAKVESAAAPAASVVDQDLSPLNPR